MKRILFTFMTLVIVLLSGCDIKGLVDIVHRHNDPEATPRILMSTAPQIMFDKIISALDNEDSEALKSLFSPNALVKVSNIDDQITALMDLYEGKLVSNSSFDSGASKGKMVNGDYTYMSISPIIEELITDKAVYSLRFDSVPADDKIPDDVGLWCIVLQLDSGDDVLKQCFVGVWYEGDSRGH